MLPWSLRPMGRFISSCGVRFAMRAGLLTSTVLYAVTVPATLVTEQQVTPSYEELRIYARYYEFGAWWSVLWKKQCVSRWKNVEQTTK